MRCMVENCTSDTEQTSKSCGITFHPLPEDEELRMVWMSALKVTVWEIDHRDMVCSKHFHSNDFYLTKCSAKKVKKGAVPFYTKDTSDHLDTAATLKMCRICLASDAKLYDITEHNFHLFYTHLTGLTIETDHKLPRMLCWECGYRLASSEKFRNRAIRSHQLMVSALGSEKCFTFRHLENINRFANGLQSSLIQKVYEPNDCDLTVCETLTIKTEPSKDDVTNDVIDYEEELEVNVSPAMVVVDTDDVLEEAKREAIEGIEVVKNEANAIFFNEFENFDSDDNLKLSEVCKKPAKYRRKARVKRKKEVKSEKQVPKKKARRPRSKKTEGDDPEKIIDKYRITDVRRRKTDGLDESLFTITQLTYEEQIQEIAKRQHLLHYKEAPFQCHLCFRGFLSQERFQAHSVRHSDQSGAFECFICRSRMKTACALRKHITAQHTEKYSCNGCSFFTRNRGVAKEHQRWHAGTKYQCPHCASEFDKLTTYLGHIRIKHASSYVCELCGYTFISHKGVEVHKKKKHRLNGLEVTLEGPYCEVCQVRFLSEEAYSRHLKLSSKHTREDDPNRLRNDGQSTNAERRNKVPRPIDKRPVVLPQIRDETAENGENRPGENAPGENGPAETEPINCEQCGLSLKDLRLYAQHFRRAHPDKNRTKYPTMRTPFMCEQCGRIFQSMALLKDHMWVHTGEKRFKCTSCDKSFTQKSNLVFHLRVHSAERPMYACPLCDKQFAFFNNRRRHMFIHTGLKPYQCDTCSKCFTTVGEHRAHVQHVHMKKPWPKRARDRGEWPKAQA